MKKIVGIESVLSLFCAMALVTSSYAVDVWTDISTTALLASKGIVQTDGFAYMHGCSGIGVNRLNGDVVVKVISFGLYRSTDQGVTWSGRIDNNMVSGRDETGWGFDIDQNNPVRMAVFSLDGDAGYTNDGITWKKFTGMGRNWDLGSVDWGSPDPKTILALRHEYNNEIDLSTDGGVTWKPCFTGQAGSTNGTAFTIGVLDATTLIRCTGQNAGISRSTDLGATWTQVSTFAPLTETVTKFKGVAYLGTATGLIVSKDKGLTWQKQGGSVNIYQGPFFGADENTMVVVGALGIYKTTDAGTTWTKISNLMPDSPQGYCCAPKWFGCYSWDPVHNVIYCNGLTMPTKKNVLTVSSASVRQESKRASSGFSIANSSIRSSILFDRIELFSLSGKNLCEQRMLPTYSARIPATAGINGAAYIVRISTKQGSIESLCK